MTTRFSWRKAYTVILLGVTFLLFSSGNPAHGQFYYNGRGPMNVKWWQTKTDGYKLVYPESFAPTAKGLEHFLDSIMQTINYGFTTRPQRLPMILHTENLNSNGEVVWAPKRVELMTASPAGGIHADLWIKQLTVHEARHVAQLSSLRKGLTKALSFVFGQAGTSVGMLCLPKWYLEGDATLAETQYSEFGRGLQPSFTVGMRAFLADDPSNTRIKTDRWIAGSYRDYTPGVYEFGYQMVAAGERYFGVGTWSKAVEYVGKYPILIVPMRIYLKRNHRTTITSMVDRALTDLKDWWEPYSAVPNDYRTLTAPERSYTNYADPVYAAGTQEIVAAKSDYDTPVRLVGLRRQNGGLAERKLAWIASPSSRLAVDGNTLYWTEMKPHPVWEFKNSSVIRSLDLATGKKGKTYGRGEGNYFVTPLRWNAGAETGTNYFATVRPTLQSGSEIVLRDAQFQEVRTFGFKTLTSVHGLTWDARTGQLVFIALDERGMWLGGVDPSFAGDPVEITQPSMITLSDLRGDGKGTLYFSSIQSGKDEIHQFDLRNGEERRVTTSRFGAYAPAAGATPDELLLTTYTADGQMLAAANLTASGREYADDTIGWSRLPENLLNIPGPKWEVPKMSEISLTASESDSVLKPRKTRRYNKALRWFNVHTWVPGVAVNAEKIIDEQSIELAFGASVFFQSAMGDSYGGASYGRQHGYDWVTGQWTYAGLPVKFTFDAEYGGGKQKVYRRWLDYNEGAVPGLNRKNYFRGEVTASLPLNLSGGAHSRLLQPSLSVSHYNALLFNGEEQTYEKGYQKYRASLWWSDNRKAAYRAILPRWGYALRADVTGAFQSRFGTQYSVYARGYLPGILPHHTTTLRVGASYQNGPQWNFKQKPIFPRGVDNDFPAKRYIGWSADYTFPILYPDGGINSIVYFKRIWLNLFGDYGTGHYFASNRQTVALNHYSYGGDIAFDVNVLGSELPVTVKLTLAKPSDDKIFVGFGFTMNF